MLRTWGYAHICPICGAGTDKPIEATVTYGNYSQHRCSKKRLRQIERENEEAEEDRADECEQTEEQRLCDGFSLLNNEGANVFRPCDCE